MSEQVMILSHGPIILLESAYYYPGLFFPLALLFSHLHSLFCLCVCSLFHSLMFHIFTSGTPLSFALQKQR